MQDFGALNYAVLIVYLIAMIAVGIWAGRSQKSSAGYYIGEGRVHYVLVGLSLLGTYLSALTMMSLPRMAYGPADWTWTVQLPCLILTAVVITRIVLPRYRQEDCVSVYEFLEKRIHVSVRLIAAVCFILLSIGRMGLVLYLPALAFSRVTDVDLTGAIIVLGLVVTVFTVLGGMRGVIVTDAIQVVIFVVGALATLFFVFSPEVDFLAVANAHHKFRTFDWRVEFTEAVTLWLVLETIISTIRIYATQQDMTQRYLSTESTAKANRSVWISIIGYIPLGYLFYFIGTALFVFYQAHPDPRVLELQQANHLDSLYAYFVVTQMPGGMAGLVMAAFCAASLSTISSSMNSGALVCVEDFYRRFSSPGKSDEHYLRAAKLASLLLGLLSIAMALYCRSSTGGAAQVFWNKIMSISTCGMLGLMALAFLPQRIRASAALTGWLTSIVALIVMMYFLQVKPVLALVYPIPQGAALNFLIWPIVTNVLCFVVALLVNAFLPWRSPEKLPAEHPEPAAARE